MRFSKLDLLLYGCNRVIAWIPSHTIRLMFYRRLMRFQLGRDSYIFMGAFIDAPSNFMMGNNSVINQHCRLDTRGGITIGENVSISADVCILTADHDPSCP